MSEEVPKRANHAITLLEGLVEKLHYFYGTDRRFKTEVLKDAIEIENTLKDHAINQKETFKRLAEKYEIYYKKKQQAIDNTVADADDTKLNESIRNRYRHDFGKDRT